ncbi:CWC16 protein [Sphaerosporella brunnea]|uniref:CWC16 protein n=1 Tax=Sphaerosporella brunnea TaxID=1250544 RepID=A0A5J5F1Z3_9PEZI|nr:CWC16 protein [Sphaerosporella brunnea]
MQGFNMGRYIPPEFEGQTTGNKLHGKKPPGFRGDKQTVRFEMPFNIFCMTCDGHIAQGVRFNAEKKKVGNYFSTPIFSFRMRHTVCSGWIEIRTDPQNTSYVVIEGAKKKAADDELAPGVIKIHDPAEATLEDPFARAEKSVVDKTVVKQGAARIAELKDLSDRQWADPYEHSRKMRKVFRVERKVLNEKAAAAEAICDRAGLSIELLDEIPEDAQRAKLIKFGDPSHEQKIFEAHSKPLFDNQRDRLPDTHTQTKSKLKSQQAREKTKELLQKDLVRNTRAALDPFLGQPNRPRPDLGIKIHKRKARDISKDANSPHDSAIGNRAEVTVANDKKANMSLELDYSSE